MSKRLLKSFRISVSRCTVLVINPDFGQQLSMKLKMNAMVKSFIFIMKSKRFEKQFSSSVEMNKIYTAHQSVQMQYIGKMILDSHMHGEINNWRLGNE